MTDQPPGSTVDRLQILLIEDDDGDARLLALLLAESELRTELIRARSLAEVRSPVAGNTFDLALVDLHLPDGHGLDTVLQVRANLEDTPLIVLTGTTGEQLPELALQEGVQDFLSKNSLEPSTVVRAIRYALDRLLPVDQWPPNATQLWAAAQRHSPRPSDLVGDLLLASALEHEDPAEPVPFVLADAIAEGIEASTIEPGAVTVTVATGHQVTGVRGHVDPDFLPYLCEPFRQAEPGSRGGLGLGLKIVERLVEDDGGSIRYESAAPTGAASSSSTRTTSTGGARPAEHRATHRRPGAMVRRRAVAAAVRRQKQPPRETTPQRPSSSCATPQL